jgi:hypothetical protein
MARRIGSFFCAQTVEAEFYNFDQSRPKEVFQVGGLKKILMTREELYQVFRQERPIGYHEERTCI